MLSGVEQTEGVAKAIKEIRESGISDESARRKALFATHPDKGGNEEVYKTIENIAMPQR